MTTKHPTPPGLVPIAGFYGDPSMLPQTFVTMRCISCAVAAGPPVEGKHAAASYARSRRWDVHSDEHGVFGACEPCAKSMNGGAALMKNGGSK